MGWRRAESLVVLAKEIVAVSPETVIYDIGDAKHAASVSAHNPNGAGVVCAIDIMAGHGLDLADLAEKIRTSGHPDLAYVIYNRRIASAKNGLRWAAYSGSDPHTGHIHVTVGTGSDRDRQPPYDDLTPWGISEGDPLMALTEDDQQALIWRAEALISNRPVVGGGPYKGKERNAVHDALAALAAQVEALTEAVAKLTAPADLPGEVEVGEVDLGPALVKVLPRVRLTVEPVE